MTQFAVRTAAKSLLWYLRLLVFPLSPHMEHTMMQ